MDFQVQNTNDFYPLICSWWKAWKWDEVPRDALPEKILLTSEENRPICAVFLYTTNSKVSVLEYLVSDPTSSKEVRDQAVDTILKGSVSLARGLGFSYIFHSTKHPKLIQRFKNLNFAETPGMTSLWGKLN